MSSFSQSVEANKASALKIGKKAVLGYLSARMSILTFGPLNALVGFLISIFLEILINKTEFAVFFKYVDMRVDKQGAEFDDIAMRWYLATPEQRITLEPEYLAKFYKLAKVTT